MDLGELEHAQKILDELHALGRPDFRPQLTFWEEEITKTRLRARPSAPVPVQVGMALIQGPVWLKPTEDSAQIAPARQAESPNICFLGSTAALSGEAAGAQWQLANPPGRMSRALPLFLAEQMFFRTGVTVQVLMPVIAGESGAFLLGGAPWSDAEWGDGGSEAWARARTVVAARSSAESSARGSAGGAASRPDADGARRRTRNGRPGPSR